MFVTSVKCISVSNIVKVFVIVTSVMLYHVYIHIFIYLQEGSAFGPWKWPIADLARLLPCPP